MSQALSGIRVIDMTHNQAGPACAQILGFLGADVIKLEEPKGGDVARTNMRDKPDSDSLFFLLFNANKRSLTLNLKTEDGQGAVQGGRSPSPTCCWRISGRARWTGWGSAMTCCASSTRG